ncbi:metallo-beta-lactamase family protein [Cnuella takakiae]|uniref:Metallo-beta-lactamase family protein n=1 Tax=Cnuella takakiae TaxID=1302690 RepID=A0A1M5AUI1_9BACT|nr:MBL fold metallo-hydrolase [Cnuella takakiae]OLY93232.1 MBL fold metallo-hydrolase [Cnuella takakiae]SHF33928.1 metallo-beta-lactamase family protein [Cnuella takakiae]
MKIAFHGAARTVTGSKHLLTLKNGTTILLDCGLFQGMGKETDPLNRDFGFIPSQVDIVVLSHGHIDHCGLVPRLVAEGFTGPVFCTPATVAVAALLMEDSARIQESDIKYTNKKRRVEGRPLVEPLYTVTDARTATQQFKAVDYNQWTPVSEGVELMFTDAGHIIGSAAVHLRITEDGQTRQVSFSGDLGRYRDVILRSPAPFPQADFIIMESTYGNSLHASISSSVDLLLQWIEKVCLKRKGKLIIPAFSLGRTQEILYALNQLELENRLPKVDYFLDSPLSIATTDLVKRFPEYFNKQIQQVLKADNDPFQFPGLRYITTVEESKLLNYHKEPCVIISASGMAEAGRVKHHISNNIENSRNAILMSGYCEPHSLGGRLLAGNKEVSIFGIEHEVHAEIGAIKSMSAHGDYEDMCQWLACQDTKQVQQLFLVHGEYDVQCEFKERLLRKGFTDVQIPAQHQEFGL